MKADIKDKFDVILGLSTFPDKRLTMKPLAGWRLEIVTMKPAFFERPTTTCRYCMFNVTFVVLAKKDEEADIEMIAMETTWYLGT